MPLVAHPVRSLWGSQPRCARCVCEWLHRKWDGAIVYLYHLVLPMLLPPGEKNVAHIFMIIDPDMCTTIWISSECETIENEMETEH